MAGDRQKRILVRVFFVLGAVLLYVGAVFGVWRVGARNAQHKTEELLDYASGDVEISWNVILRSALEHSARTAMKNLRAPSARPVAEMRRVMDGCGLDELYVVDPTGRILVAGTDGRVGADLATLGGFDELLALTNAAVPRVDMSLRASLAQADRRTLYSGYPFADGAFVVCGLYEQTLARHLAQTGNDFMSTWQVGETGTILVVDDRTGTQVFDVCGKEGQRGRTLAEIGAGEVVALGDSSEKTHVGTFFGEPCYYRNFHYLGLRFVPILPKGEFYANVLNTTLVAAFVLLLVFGIFCAILVFTSRLRAARDAQHEKDMKMAKSIQAHSLPTVFPPYPDHVEHFDIFAFMRTAKVVGGDFYDFFFVGQDKLALVIADVSGKGVPAAMFMMRAKTTIQSQMKRGLTIAEAVGKVNNSLCLGNSDNMFVTAWIGVCDLATGEVEYVNAGHNPPIVSRADGVFEWVPERSGLVLAAMEGAVYRPKHLKLAPGDGLFLYTDGLTEAQDAQGTLYGENRLEVSVRLLDAQLDAKAFCGRVMAELDGFVGAAEQADDITLLDFRLKKHTTGVRE